MSVHVLVMQYIQCCRKQVWVVVRLALSLLDKLTLIIKLTAHTKMVTHILANFLCCIEVRQFLGMP